MRLFFAIALEEPLRAAMGRELDRLERRLSAARAGRAVKWVERENLHVTMRFLGEVKEARAAELIRGAAQPLEHSGFDLGLGGGGAFPAAGAPRVLWAGVPAGAAGARAVFQLLDARLAPLGFEPEPRAYTPHVTLGRVREIDRERGRELRAWLTEVPAHLGVQHVRAVTLYRSELLPAGPRYEVVAEVPLS